MVAAGGRRRCPIEKANGVTARSLRIGQELTIPPVE